MKLQNKAWHTGLEGVFKVLSRTATGEILSRTAWKMFSRWEVALAVPHK